MKLSKLAIDCSWHAESPVWADDRGSFREWFKSEDVLAATGIDFSVAQANISESKRGVVRGIHYSLAKAGQAKWVTCVSGAIRDVIVDIRPESDSYGQFVAVDLLASSGQAVLIGSGLGHGFIALEDHTTVAYLVSSAFSPREEFEINPLDPDLSIDWGMPVNQLLLSPKDAAAPGLMQRSLQGQLPAKI